jgi:DNA-binding CsgD family transcriptional regulator
MFHEGLPWTPAELRVIQLLCQGLKPRDIAEKHKNSLYTIRTHIANARERVGVKSVAHLVVIYLKGEERPAA